MSTDADQALLKLEQKPDSAPTDVGTSIIGPKLDRICRDIGSRPERTIHTEFD